MFGHVSDRFFEFFCCVFQTVFRVDLNFFLGTISFCRHAAGTENPEALELCNTQTETEPNRGHTEIWKCTFSTEKGRFWNARRLFFVGSSV